MCNIFDCFKKPRVKRKERNLYCSCDVCGQDFDNTGYLLTHIVYHDTSQLNRLLDAGYGTVRCKQCWAAFKTVVDLENHSCEWPNDRKRTNRRTTATRLKYHRNRERFPEAVTTLM